MFANAYAVASQYTRPVIVNKRLEDGRVVSGCATFIVLNPDGWVLTAAHVMSDAGAMVKHRAEMAKYRVALEQIENHPQMSAKQKRRQIRELQKNPEWITNLSYWWAGDNITAPDPFQGDIQADIAISRLRGIERLNVTAYPTFAAAGRALRVGTSLCRLGFPFHQVNASFDPATSRFRIENLPPLPMFPNEGIHTRIMQTVNVNNNRTVSFVETSSPGLRGQSGGPIFDVNGHIWAIQSKTLSLPLGFSPKVQEGGREITEHQFIHIGVGCHVQHVIEFLTNHGVAFQSA